MKGMRDKDELNAEIADDGSITVENHFVGRLKGFRFTLDLSTDGIQEKATRAAATHVLARELGMRVRRVTAAQNDAFKLTRNGRIMWRDDEIARLEAADDPLQPSLSLLTDEHIAEADKEKVLQRLQTWIKELIADKLKPLVELSNASDLQGLARGIAFRLKENLGVLKREAVADEISALDQPARASLRKHGLRFGAFNIYFPVMMKPAAAELTVTLFALKYAQANGLDLDKLPELPRPGLTSAAADATVPEAYYRAYGFHLCGPRAVRLDILERLADIIRPLLAWRQKAGATDAPPKGATGDGGFRATEEMMSILGTSSEELGNVLKALGFRLERRAIPAASPAQAVMPLAVSSSGDVPTAEASPPADETPAAVVALAVETKTVPTESSGETQSAAEAPAAVEEQKFEDIWRPRRHQRAEKSEKTEPRRDHHRRSSHKHSGTRPDVRHSSQSAIVPEGGAAASAAIPADGLSSDLASDLAKPQSGDQRSDANKHGADRGARRERHSEGDRDRRPKPQGGDRPRVQKGGGDNRDRPGGGARFDKGPRFDKGRREEVRRQPEVITASPPKRSGVDPDSPFAALAALKASLNKRGEGAGS